MNNLPLPPYMADLTLIKIAEEIALAHPVYSEFLRWQEDYLEELRQINKHLKHDAEIRESLILGMEKVLYAIRGSKP